MTNNDEREEQMSDLAGNPLFEALKLAVGMLSLHGYEDDAKKIVAEARSAAARQPSAPSDRYSWATSGMVHDSDGSWVLAGSQPAAATLGEDGELPITADGFLRADAKPAAATGQEPIYQRLDLDETDWSDVIKSVYDVCCKHPGMYKTRVVYAVPVETLKEISHWLTVMMMSASCSTDADTITGYRIKTGAIHRVVGILAGAGYPVLIPSNMPIDAAGQEPVGVAEAGKPQWRELCRRLYVELFHCNQQMTQHRDENDEVVWTQGVAVRDALADAKAALESAPYPSHPAESNGLDDLLHAYAVSIRRDDGTAFMHADVLRAFFRGLVKQPAESKRGMTDEVRAALKEAVRRLTADRCFDSANVLDDFLARVASDSGGEDADR